LLKQFGAKGEKWLSTLERTISFYEKMWNINVSTPFANLSYHYVAPATCSNGQGAVLKLGVPHTDFSKDVQALERYDSNCMVKIIKKDIDNGAVLLARVHPGRLLASLNDDESATTVACNIMEDLWRNHRQENIKHVRTAASWLNELNSAMNAGHSNVRAFSSELLTLYKKTSEHLLLTMGKSVLNHGDLHHFNILQGPDNRWIAIDPKGVFAEPEFEIGALLRNPVGTTMQMQRLETLIEARVRYVAERFGFNSHRLYQWGFVLTLLASWWSYSDAGPNYESWLTLAKHLSSYL
jgi:streptomycin 6-kinase